MNKPHNLAASVRQRLKNHSIAQKEDFQSILTRSFLKKAKLDTQEQSLNDIADLIDSFMMPPCFALTENRDFDMHWRSNLAWRRK